MKYWIIDRKDDISLEIKEQLKKQIQWELSDQNPDYVIVIGGDGAFISAVHQYPNAIFFGVHTGHLGFYANYTLDDIEQLVIDINEGKYCVEKIDALKIHLTSEEQVIDDFAINECTIITLPKTLLLNVAVDERKLEKFKGTGLCISTTYGSTAYNKSLSGAVLDPQIKAFQLTEIAGINSNQYRTLSSPLVLSSKRTISLEAAIQEEVFVTVDNLSYSLRNFKSGKLYLEPDSVSIAHSRNAHFVERLRRAFL